MTKNTGKNSNECGCGSGKKTDECCISIIEGRRQAETAEQLMRSRYVAYSSRNEAYILASWHPSTRPLQLDLSADTHWTRLQVIRHKDEGERASVEFIASYVSGGIAGQMHELSRFIKQQGAWFYQDGEQIDDASARNARLPGRNEPCCCGSGRKYKKCCGKAL